jgi:rfaE bifunctional protein nucleotidyltransferase chain/domain
MPNLMEFKSKIVSFENAGQVFGDIKKVNKTIALCHGVFDLLHPGHMRHLNKAKSLADVLVVSITADNFVNKGPGRPAFNENLRAESLANLLSVDYVIITPFATAIEIIESVRPNFYVKGKDYLDEKSDATGNITLEKQIVESNGGNLVNTDEIVFSSSKLINQFMSNYSSEVNFFISEIKKNYGLEYVLSWLQKVSALKIAIVGETIIDTYTNCEALGKSSKDPVLCFSKGNSVSHAGGVLAIAGHCNGLEIETKVITGLNHADLNNIEIMEIKARGIKIKSIDTSPAPTIRKERIVDSRTSMRVLELYEMQDDPLPVTKDLEFIQIIKEKTRDVDVVIIADYGHGLISDAAIKYLTTSKKFLALNTQVNAGNRGFNSVSRYSRADFITLNGNEAQLETRRRHTDIQIFINSLQSKMGAKQILVTKGASGIELYDAEQNICKSPALAPYIKDRVGAGDAVLSVTAPLAYLNAPAEIISFFGNLVGAWAVTFVGNEKSITKGNLIRQITSILQ